MSFINIAINNIKKGFSNYLMYFISTITSVTLFTLFCSVYFNPQFEKYRSGGSKMGLILEVAAVIVMIFSAVFILYSNKFFLKKRKKEIAIYSLLGMRKNKIGQMLFFENIIMGMFATACGIILGVVFSRFFVMILFKLMATGTKVAFSFQIKTVTTPIIAFFILFIITSLNAYSIIYRNKLIDLLTANKEGEPLPKYSVLGGILSILFIAAGDIITLRLDVSLGMARLVLPVFASMILILVGTVLLFKNFIPMAVVKLKKDKHFYYKTSNFISTSQIVYRIKANSTMLSVIAILCTATMTMTSVTYALYHGLKDSVAYYAPFSYMTKNIDETQYKNIANTVRQIGKVKITGEDEFKLIKAQVKNSKYSNQMVSKPGTINDAFILSENDYKSIIKTTKTKTGSMSNIKTDFKGGLKDNECYFIDGNMSDIYSKNLKGSKANVYFNGRISGYDITGAALHKYIGCVDLFLKPTIVVSDKTYNSYLNEAKGNSIIKFNGFMFDNPMNSESTVTALNKFIPKSINMPGVPNVSYIGMFRGLFSSYGVFTFIGLFLGILFMFATGSIIYYKQIIEAQEEAARYDILRKTGMRKEEARKSISKQLGIVFACPLLVGILHTFPCLIVNNRMSGVLGKETPTLLNALVMMAIFVAAYGFFYVISVRKYLRIVWNK